MVNPYKLKWLQRKYAQKYAKEPGGMFESTVDRIFALAQKQRIPDWEYVGCASKSERFPTD